MTDDAMFRHWKDRAKTAEYRLKLLDAECERLRAALGEFVSIVGTSAGFETAMVESDDVFTEFLNKQQARVDSAVANARELLDAARKVKP